MKKQERIIWMLVIGLVGSGLFMLNLFTSVSAEELNEWVAQFNLYADHHHEPVTPRLSVNYSEGRPGSYFTFTGQGFPLMYEGLVTVNGHPGFIVQKADA